MGSFIANEAVEALEYDLRPHANKNGVIPEPSQEALENFYKRIEAAQKTLPKDKDKASFSAKDVAKFNSLMVDAIANLTDGELSRADLGGLPVRVLNAFVKWIIGEMSPKDEKPGTNS